MSRKSKKPKPRGGHLKAVPSAPKLPLQLVLNHRVVDSLTPDFVHWFEGFSDAQDALQCLEVVKLFMTTSHAISDASSATRFDPDGLEDAAVALADTLDDADMDQALDQVHDYLHLYVDFLSETGRWSGSAEEYSSVHALLTEGTADGVPDFPPIQLPELSAEEQDRAFRELPVLQLAGRLLEWLGEGKDVTSTGVLRLKDVEGAAAAVGVKAKGKKSGKRPLEPLFDIEEYAQGQSESFEVRSMHDVPVLRGIWAALFDAGILSLGSTRAVPGTGANSWNSQDLDSRQQIRRKFLVVFLASAVMNSGDMGQVSSPANELLATVLIRGTTGEPVGVDELSKSKEPGAVEDIFLAFSAMRARTQLAGLADLGLITVDTHYKVPSVVIQCVPAALALVLAMEDDFEPEGFDGFPDAPRIVNPAEDAAPGPRRTAAAPPSSVIQMRSTRPTISGSTQSKTGSTFQLKIQLKGSTPPVWRRVLVPGNIRLSGLHEVIQCVFGWLDYHLHSFEVGGSRGVSYGPRNEGSIHDLYDERMRDESSTALQELLTVPGDKMAYTYDFGDDWVHAITLEKILGSSEGQELPRCTGGRGLAPAEDSGGVWGWRHKIEVANNPADEDHKDIREWLGLAPGEILDPEIFDAADADAQLEHLR